MARPMKTVSRRKFLRLPLAALSAMLPVATAHAQNYPMPPEPENESITTDSLNKRLMFLEKDNLWRDITVKYLEWNVSAMLRCFHGCGSLNLPRRYRL
jgi:hypothetical protein